MAAETVTCPARTQAIEAIDGLSLELYRIGRVAHVVAFAAEARRVLKGIELATAHSPEFNARLDECIKARISWTEMEEATGAVGQWVAEEVDRINTAMTDLVYSLAKNLHSEEASHG